MTAEDLKVLLSTPVALFVLMILGSLISMAKQYRDAKKNGSTITFKEYLFQVETFIMLGANTAAFIGLIMTDTLNWTGAIAIGYMANSASDGVMSGGRSAAIIDKVPDSTPPGG